MIKLGNIYGFDGGNFAGNVYDTKGLAPSLLTMTGGNRQPMILIKQATKQGFIEMEDGGVADLSYPSSKTRRGRVQCGGAVSPTLTATHHDICKIERDGYEYRIRKLTPKECFRLMGVTDEDADKMMAVNSNTQCYKQAGNSIVVDVLAAIFKELIA